MSAKNIIFIAGQNGTEPNSGRTLRSIESQTRQALENLVHAIKPTGLDREALARCTIYITNIEDSLVVDTVYHDFFAKDKAPPKTIIGVNALPRVNDAEILITIEAVAIQRG